MSQGFQTTQTTTRTLEQSLKNMDLLIKKDLQKTTSPSAPKATPSEDPSEDPPRTLNEPRSSARPDAPNAALVVHPELDHVCRPRPARVPGTGQVGRSEAWNELSTWETTKQKCPAVRVLVLSGGLQLGGREPALSSLAFQRFIDQTQMISDDQRCRRPPTLSRLH